MTQRRSQRVANDERTGEPAEEPAPQTPLTVPVLLYHHLEPGADGANGAVISTEEFAADGLAGRQRDRSVTTAELLDWLKGRQSLPDRPVMITFDDGYRSNYTDAYPVLQQHGFTGVVFMVTSFAGQNFGSLEYLGWEEECGWWHRASSRFRPIPTTATGESAGSPALMAWSEEEILDDWFKLTEARRPRSCRPSPRTPIPSAPTTRKP